MSEATGPVLTFDSGLGGLSVFRHLVKSLPHHDHVYVADDVGFPYGDWQEKALIEHCVTTIDDLIAMHRPSVVVIACNTASTLVLDRLRHNHDTAFVGTVPAIKPAASLTTSGLVSVLATPGTVKRDYTRALMDTYASHININLVGAERLAELADRFLAEGCVDEEAVWAQVKPCFQQQNGRKTDVIVLACTHYPLLLPILERVAAWPVTWLDPAEAIARHAARLLGDGAPRSGVNFSNRQFVMTSGQTFYPDIASSFAF